MKLKNFNYLVVVLLSAVIFSSCSHDKDIFKLIPDNASFVGTINSGDLIKKANPQDVRYIKDLASENDFTKNLLENPESSGINFKSKFAVFVYGTQEKYLGVVLPVKKQKDFESFLENISKQYGIEFKKVQSDKFSYSQVNDNILAWNKKVVIHLTRLNGQGDISLENKITELFSLKSENQLLSDKDFSSFTSEQKDINLWLTSNQIESLTGKNPGILNMIGSLNNNYAHISLDFQDGAVVLNSNINLNPDVKKQLDKYNILDKIPGKELLEMLPAENLIVAANLKLSTERILELIKMFGNLDHEKINEIEQETGKSVEDLLTSFQGNVAFCMNGKPAKADNEDITKKPIITAAIQLRDEKVYNDIIAVIKQKIPFIEKQGYLIVHSETSPVFIGTKNNILLVSDKEDYLAEIISSGKINNNVLSLDISDKLIDNPVCLYVNLDRQSYSKDVNDYINSNMNASLMVGLEVLSKSLNSLTFSTNIEKSELRIDFKYKSDNSLHTILKSMEF